MDTNNQSPIIEKLNINNLILSIILLLSGLFLTIHSCFFSLSKNLEMALIVVGVLIILLGVSLLVLKNKQKVHEKTGSIIKSQLYYISREDLVSAKNTLAAGKFENEKAVPIVDTSNVYFDTLISKDKAFASVQIFEFVSYDFQPATPLYYYTDNQALKFCEYVERCKKR
jgi:uncharacterized membrane protein